MKVTLLALILVLSSCSSAKLDYVKPQNHQIESSRKYSKTFKDVWNLLIEGLTKNNYSMDSVNKDSGLIVVSKKLKPPTLYADCGYFEGFYKNANGEQKYFFSGVESANYVIQHPKNKDIYVNVNKTTDLNSKVNILVKKTNKEIEVQVNTLYSLSIDLNQSAYVYPQGNMYWKETRPLNWSTDSRGTSSELRTECISNSYLEKEILNLI